MISTNDGGSLEEQRWPLGGRGFIGRVRQREATAQRGRCRRLYGFAATWVCRQGGAYDPHPAVHKHY